MWGEEGKNEREWGGREIKRKRKGARRKRQKAEQGVSFRELAREGGAQSLPPDQAPLRQVL